MQLNFRHLSILTIGLFILSGCFAGAATSADLQSQIDDKARQIETLKEEIKQYEQSLTKTAGQAKTLQNELNALTTSKKKLEKELSLTEASLVRTGAAITKISSEINATEESIQIQKQYLGEVIRDLYREEETNMIEVALSSKDLGYVSSYLAHTETLASRLKTSIANLTESEQRLAEQKEDHLDKKTELSKLKVNLTTKKRAVSDTANLKDKLLTDTKGQEANYQKILEEKRALQIQFENELFQYQSNLGIKVDVSGYPAARHGILSWPLNGIRITQQFGKTAFSGRLYASGTHNGTDFAASDGTSVMASLGGTVRATGNTDLKKNCYSYGKWVLIDHPNGLSTLYTHLSSIGVSAGQGVAVGETIGHSGRTGYVTGPHLHLTLLVKASTQVMTYPAEKTMNCRGVTIPIAPPTAFLDPMAYLPIK